MEKQYYKMASTYTFSYWALGVIMPLLPQYLTSEGYSGFQIGTIMSMGTAIGVLSTPIIGMMYDKYNKSKKIIATIFLVAAFFVATLTYANSYFIFLAIYVFAFLFSTPIYPLMDSNAIDSGNDFGRIRKWGAVGYAGGTLITGVFADAFGLDKIFFMYSLALVIGMIFFLSMKTTIKNVEYAEIGNDDILKRVDERLRVSKIVPQNNNTDNNVVGENIFKNKTYIKLVISAFFVAGTTIAHNNYFGFLYLDAGGDIRGIGIAFLLMVGSEIPFMQIADYLGRKYSIEKLLLFSMLLCAVRFLFFATSPDPIILLGTFFLQGAVNGIFLVKIVKYIEMIVPSQKLASAISFYSAVAVNGGTIVCQFFGGIILDAYNGATVYLAFGIMNLIGVGFYLLFGLHKKK